MSFDLKHIRRPLGKPAWESLIRRTREKKTIRDRKRPKSAIPRSSCSSSHDCPHDCPHDRPHNCLGSAPWIWNSNLKFEFQIRFRISNLNFEYEIRIWNSKLKFQHWNRSHAVYHRSADFKIEVNLKFKFGIRIRNSNSNCKLEF